MRGVRALHAGGTAAAAMRVTGVRDVAFYRVRRLGWRDAAGLVDWAACRSGRARLKAEAGAGQECRAGLGSSGEGGRKGKRVVWSRIGCSRA
jgi:hypothetical protein